MKISELCSFLDSVVPLSFQEDYDNSGLQAGQPDNEVESALLTLDVTEKVIDEAAGKGCGIVISHHPLIFGGLKRVTGRTPAEKILMKAIRNDIAIYSIHTNLDAVSNGVSMKLARKIGLQKIKVLKSLNNRLIKLVTFIPEDHLDKVREAVFNAGAGFIGKYDRCGFTVPGTGSFRAGEDTSPYAGQKGMIHFEKEVRFETVFLSHLKEKIVNALLDTHPYEEVAYDLYPLENENINHGMGCVGDLAEPLAENNFLSLLASLFDPKGIRYSRLTGRIIRKVAVCGGAGGALLDDAISARADAFVTADIKYHTWFDADGKIMLTDCGHYETEKYSTEIIYDLIIKKFPKFAVRFSETNTNPINYL